MPTVRAGAPDRSIPVPSIALPPGFDHVTRKADGFQAEAPVELLARMRTFRIFVDRATVDDGPLEVIPGSHRRGRIEQVEIPAVRGDWSPLIGEAGDIVVLSPLLLHRSRRAAEPSGRRVLQIETIPPRSRRLCGSAPSHRKSANRFRHCR